jgi:hypothetical protein
MTLRGDIMSFSTMGSSRPETHFIAEKFRPFVQSTAQILAVELSPSSQVWNGGEPLSYSHFFHLNRKYGSTAAMSIMTSAIG